MIYGFYRVNGELKYRPLPKRLLKKQRRRKPVKDKCKQIDDTLLEKEFIQPLEQEIEDEED